MADRRYPKRNGLYRSRKGMLFGVCRGLATYFDLNVVWIRVLAVISLVVTGLWPMTGIYLVAALMAWGGERMEAALHRYIDWLGWLMILVFALAIIMY